MKIESSRQTWTEQSKEDWRSQKDICRHSQFPVKCSYFACDPGYSHWTGRRQVCSLTSGSPGVVTLHSSAAPASSRPGVSTVELTRRPPSTELWNIRLEEPCSDRHWHWPESGCGSAAGHFSTMTPCDWAGPPGPVSNILFLLLLLFITCWPRTPAFVTRPPRGEHPCGESGQRAAALEIRGLQLIMQMPRKLCSTGSNIKYTSLQLRFVLLFPEV